MLVYAIIDYNKFGMEACAEVWEQYLISLFWVCTTISGNGSIGDVMPQNIVEILYCTGLMILSLTLFRCTSEYILTRCIKFCFLPEQNKVLN